MFGFGKNNTYDALSEFYISPQLSISKSGDKLAILVDTGYEDINRQKERLVVEDGSLELTTTSKYICFNDLSNNVNSLSSTPLPDDFVINESDIPDKIRFKQEGVLKEGLKYKVIETLILIKSSDVECFSEKAYYLVPLSLKGEVFEEIPEDKISFMVDEMWSDIFMDALSHLGSEDVVINSKITQEGNKNNSKSGKIPLFFKIPAVLMLCIVTASLGLYLYNSYQQKNNPLYLATGSGSVDGYMQQKGMSTDEYTKQQVDAVRATLQSMGIDVEEAADIGCLVE